MYKLLPLLFLFTLACQHADPSNTESAEIGTMEENTDAYLEKKSKSRMDQMRNRYTFRCVQECIPDSTEDHLRFRKLLPYHSEVKRTDSALTVHFIFNDDCCAKHVSFVSVEQDSIAVKVEQNTPKVCECICPYEYELVFKALDSSVQRVNINGLSIPIH